MATAWTNKEVAALKLLFPTALRLQVQAALPLRAWESIQWKAHELGVVRSADRVVAARVRHMRMAHEYFAARELA